MRNCINSVPILSATNLALVDSYVGFLPIWNIWSSEIGSSPKSVPGKNIKSLKPGRVDRRFLTQNRIPKIKTPSQNGDDVMIPQKISGCASCNKEIPGMCSSCKGIGLCQNRDQWDWLDLSKYSCMIYYMHHYPANICKNPNVVEWKLWLLRGSVKIILLNYRGSEEVSKSKGLT